MKKLFVILLLLMLTGCDALYVVPNSTPVPTQEHTSTVASSPTYTKTNTVTAIPVRTCKIIDLYKNGLTTVNMHSGNGMSFPVVHVARSNEIYDVLSENNGWIETNKGYIYKKWCK